MKSTKKKHTQNHHIVTINNLREALQYLYYRYSEFYKRTEGWDSPYKLSGFFLLGSLLAINTYSIIAFLSDTSIGLYFDKILRFPFSVSEHRWVGKAVFGGIGVIIVSSFLYLLIGKESYSEIYEKFHRETPYQRKKRKWFILIYMVLTPIVFFIAISIKHGYFDYWFG